MPIIQYSTQRFTLLPVYICLLVCIINACDILIFKVLDIHGMKIVSSGIIFPFAFLILNVMTECYGYQKTEQSVIYILSTQLLFITIISIVIRIPSPPPPRFQRLIMHTASSFNICGSSQSAAQPRHYLLSTPMRSLFRN